MPEIPENKIRLVKEGMSYLTKLPLTELSWRTGIALTKPMCAGLVITSRCNLKCPFCFLATDKDFKNKLSKKELIGLVDDLADWGINQLTVSGGEPLLDEGLFDIINHAKERGMIVGFTTNGTLLSNNIIENIRQSRVDRVSVSIDGLRQTNDALRGKGTYEKAMAGFERLSKLKGLNLRINTIIFDENLSELIEIFSIAKEHKAEFNLMPLGTDNITAVRKREITEDVINRLWVREENLKLLDDTLDKLKNLKRKHGILLNSDSFLELIKTYYRNPTKVLRKCKIATYSIGFAGDGSVVVCGPLGIIGNIREYSPREIWKSQSFKNARLKMKYCKKCLFNCQYTPPAGDLINDFVIYPLFRKIRYKS